MILKLFEKVTERLWGKVFSPYSFSTLNVLLSPGWGDRLVSLKEGLGKSKTEALEEIRTEDGYGYNGFNREFHDDSLAVGRD